jgi:hypothetical protein
MDKQRGRGRPPKPPEDSKADVLHLRVGQDERINYQKSAERCGLPLSEWVREQLNRAAKRQAKEA